MLVCTALCQPGLEAKILWDLRKEVKVTWAVANTEKSYPSFSNTGLLKIANIFDLTSLSGHQALSSLKKGNQQIIQSQWLLLKEFLQKTGANV